LLLLPLWSTLALICSSSAPGRSAVGIVVGVEARGTTVLRLVPALLSRGLLDLSAGIRTRHSLWVLVDVEPLLNMSWDFLNLASEFLLDLVQVEAIFPRDQVNCDTTVSITTRTTNSVEVGLGVLGEVKVDDYIHRLNVDTASKEVRADQITADTVAEIVENPVPVVLEHARMRVVAREAKFCNLLCKQFHAIG